MDKTKKILLDLFLSKRARSFYWRTVMMALAGLFAVLSDEIVDYQLTTQSVVILGLLFGEISKGIANTVKEYDIEG